jgi:hypothetical protein
MDALDRLIGLTEASGRLTARGYAPGVIAKGGSVESRTVSVAGDVVERATRLATDLLSKLDRLRERIDANAQGIAQIQTADLQRRLSLAMARPAAGIA